MEPLFEMCIFFLLLVSKSQLIEISLLKYLSSEYYAVNFFNKLVIDNSGRKGFDFFF